VTDFDPDEALAEMGEFVNGAREEPPYGGLAYRFRQLHNHISAGGRLPRRWSAAQVITIKHYAPEGETSRHEIGIADEYRAALDQRSNWMVVTPGSDFDDEARLASLRPARQLVTELLADMEGWSTYEGGPESADLDAYRERARHLGLMDDDD
jgi:hypothetical protein